MAENLLFEDAQNPVQFVPPVLGFDELYLYPSEAYERATTEYQAYLKERQEYYSAKATHERAQASHEREQERQAAAQSRHLQAQAEAVAAATRRENEAQAAGLKKQQAEFAAIAAQNKELQKLAAQSAETAATAKADVKRIQGVLGATQARLKTVGLVAVFAMSIVGFAGYRFGDTQKSRLHLQSQIEVLSEQKSLLEVKTASLEEEVRRLTPPPPPDVDPAALQPLLLAQYKTMDAAHNQEDADKLYSVYDTRFVLVTNGFTNNLTTVKSSNQTDFFQPDTLHEQVTELVSKPEANKPSNVSTSDPTAAASASGSEAHPTGNPVPALEVVDKDTVILPVIKTIYTWKHVAVAPRPSAAPSGASDAAGSSSTVSSTAPVPPETPPAKSLPEFENRDTRFQFEDRDTWKRKGGHWLLVKTETMAVSETNVTRTPPTFKCRNVSCGDYYYRGLDMPFDEAGNAIKRCPRCGRRLFLLDVAP